MFNFNKFNHKMTVLANLNLHTYYEDQPVLKSKLGKHPSSIVLSQTKDDSKPLKSYKISSLPR